MKSESIKARQTREIKRAVRHAWRIGKPLNKWVVINFPTPPEGYELVPQRVFTTIRKKAWTWWDYHRKKGMVSGSFYDCRVWENPNGFLHVNWLMHVPENLEATFHKKAQEWYLKVITDGKDEDFFIRNVENTNGLLKYLLKGTEAGAAAAFGINHIDQGTVWGRRAVPSMSLGRARREKDWKGNAVIEKEWKYSTPPSYRSAKADAE